MSLRTTKPGHGRPTFGDVQYALQKVLGLVGCTVSALPGNKGVFLSEFPPFLQRLQSRHHRNMGKRKGAEPAKADTSTKKAKELPQETVP